MDGRVIELNTLSDTDRACAKHDDHVPGDRYGPAAGKGLLQRLRLRGLGKAGLERAHEQACHGTQGQSPEQEACCKHRTPGFGPALAGKPEGREQQEQDDAAWREKPAAEELDDEDHGALDPPCRR